MQHCELVIVYQPASGDAIELARISDERLLREAACKAISDSTRWGEHVAKSEPGLGLIERAEASKLRSILTALVGLDSAKHDPVSVI